MGRKQKLLDALCKSRGNPVAHLNINHKGWYFYAGKIPGQDTLMRIPNFETGEGALHALLLYLGGQRERIEGNVFKRKNRSG